MKTLSFTEGAQTLVLTSLSEPFEAGLSNVEIGNVSRGFESAISFRMTATQNSVKITKFYKVLLEGDDASDFIINVGYDGVYVVFKRRPEFDSPEDQNSDNTYHFTYVVKDTDTDSEILKQKYKIVIT